ncbi:MAG: tetratricopeptide repeat protein [Candidatus Firestonebacteria bacterium]
MKKLILIITTIFLAILFYIIYLNIFALPKAKGLIRINGVSPSCSPDGKWIVFSSFASTTSNSLIYKIDSTGNNQKRLTKILYGDCILPYWSPNGEYIAYFRCTDGKYSLNIVTADGKDEWELTSVNLISFPISWNPDSNKIAFTDLDKNRNINIFTIDIMDKSKINLTDKLKTSFNAHPSWSPDNKYIIFASNKNGYINIWKISELETNNFVFTQLTKYSSNIKYPMFSNDGTKIVFYKSKELWLTNSDGSMQTCLVKDYVCDDTPSVWSPDDKMILFQSKFNLYVYNFRNKVRKPLTEFSIADTCPIWAEKGEKIVFAYVNGKKTDNSTLQFFEISKIKKYLVSALFVAKPKKIEAEEIASGLNKQGITYYDRGKYEKAILSWKKAIKLDSNMANLYRNISIAHRKIEKLKKSDFYISKSIKKDPQFSDAYYTAIITELEKHNFEKALSLAKKSVQIDPNNLEKKYSTAYCYWKMEEYQQTINICKEIIKINSKHIRAHYVLSLCLEEIGEGLTAAEEFNKFLELLHEEK